MRFVNILPTEFIDKPWCWTSDVHLPLAHLIEDGNEYTKKFKEIRVPKILDNGFFELGKNPPIDELVDKAELIGAQSMILPDTFWSDDFEEKVMSMVDEIPTKFRIMAIPLGKNLEEVLNAFECLNDINMNEIHMIAIPDRLLSKWTELSRPKFLDLIESKFLLKKKLHMLALDHYWDLPKLNRKYVRSIDSTTPFKMGYFKHKMNEQNFMDVKRPKDYFEIKELDTKQIECIKYNKDFVIRKCKR